ncbi:MAG TPA: sugar nucleotide-binding protein [Intrasporangium sp.]|uniref:SDR family oxidoreductase n=1 Tax=Intrasporangium sp. TaxID=1925024 RepID=UPI002B496164|nr:sugar nucleotide-binding protein [Intrasporangium sp.]HKX66297.1 sugar nucleotide-binding protein [Intrasporangium sp.]
MHLLVVGGSGFLGREIVRQSRAAGHAVTATFHSAAPLPPGPDWRQVDVRDRDVVTRLAEDARPDLVINAAYLQADWATTADGATHVALAAAAVGARLVHVSSDVVFSGDAATYDETCLPDPVSPYGAAKAAAETAVKGIAPDGIIARTSLILGDGDSPSEKLVHAVASGSGGALFSDEIRCPVHVSDLASALLELAESSHHGVHHVAGADAVSRYELGVLIARRDGLDHATIPRALRAASTLRGPIDVRLDSTRTQAKLRTRLRGARTFLASDAG